ncbi:MAG: hypothetical protein ABI867_36155 [Kofleriaceae bacterium]
MARKTKAAPPFAAFAEPWAESFAALADEPAAPPIADTHWQNARKEFWRFEPGGNVTYGLSGGLFPMQCKQRGAWLYLTGQHIEIIARVDGDLVRGYHRSQPHPITIEYGRADAATIDAYIAAKRAHTAWLLGPRTEAAPPMPTWPPRAPKRAADTVAAKSLRFANHRPPRAPAAMTAAEHKHLAKYAGTIKQQAEFGGVEAIDLLDDDKAAYHLYWWPFTDGILVDAKGKVLADLLDGSISIEDDALRESVADAHRASSADGTLPKTLSGVRIA